MEKLLRQIVSSDILHQRWLETLSHLENCGARKIHAVQPAREVPFYLLQHAAEESRHALLFKIFTRKLHQAPLDHAKLLGLPLGRRYLDVIDLWVSRVVRRELSLCNEAFHHACYLVTTYTIEKRAEVLYPLYQRVLEESQARFSLEEIIREESQHLKLIASQISKVPDLENLIAPALDFEAGLFYRWQRQIQQDLALR